MTTEARQRVLVTGAGGFIGSHLVEALVESGYGVRAFVRYNSRSDIGLLTHLPPSTLNDVEIVAGDLRDSSAVTRAVSGVDTVFHLGALIAIPYSYSNPVDVLQANLLGAVNVFQAALSCGIRRVVHTSSSEVYGTARYVPMDESHPLQAQSPYAASKIAADKAAESYHLSFGLPVVTVRPFNTYGPRQSARAVIPTIAVQALTGTTIRLGSLSPVRDFNYVSDTVRGFILASQAEEAVGLTLNLGSGAGVSIGDLTRLITQLAGGEKRLATERERLRPPASEVMRLVASASLAAKVIGWKTLVPLADGLRMTVEWIKEHMHFYGRPERFTI